jgi:mono/diheme cytochrome c family protein
MRSAIALLFGLALAVGACNKKEEGGGGTASTSAAVSPEAEEIFTSRCSTCHGTDGKGNGPAAANLTPKPRDYTDPAWQSATTDQQLKDVIVKGGAAVGKSALMPPNPDLESKPEVVNGLVAKIRSFKK